MGTYLGRWDIERKINDGQVEASEALDLVKRYLNDEYPLDGYTSERLSLDSFYSSDWQIIGAATLIKPTDGLSAGFRASFSKADGSSLVADFFAKGINAQNDFKEEAQFTVNALLASGDKLDIEVKTMMEGVDGVLMPDGLHEYPVSYNSEFYDIYYKNTNGTPSSSDDVIIEGNQDGTGSSKNGDYSGKDKGSYKYQDARGSLSDTYGGTWNDAYSSSSKSGGQVSINYDDYFLDISYAHATSASAESFTISKLTYEVPEFKLEMLKPYTFNVPEAPDGYESYLDQAFNAYNNSGEINAGLLRAEFDQYMLPFVLKGNNVITGGSGDDFIDGGVGADTAVYSGNFSQYAFTKNANNNWVITDTVVNRDGIDTIRNIETLRFLDKKSVSVSSLKATEVPGVVSIQAVYDDDAGEYGLYLASNKALVIADSGLSKGSSVEDALTLLASNGKNFAFKPAAKNFLLVDSNNSNPAKTYSIVYGKDKSWSQQFFNEEGIAVGRAGKLSYSDVLSLEVAFDRDITGEGDIGDAIVEVLVSSEVGGVYKLASGAFAIDDVGFTDGQILSSGSLLLKSSAIKNWTPGSGDVLGLIEDGAVYKMIVKNGARYSELTFNESGIQVGRPINLTSAALVERELDAGTDLTGDGYVGFIEDSKAVAKDAVDTFEGNGSVYSVYSTPMTWAKANAYAKSLGGQLAVVEDESENDFLYQQIMDLMSSSDLAKSTAKDGGGAAYVWLGATDAVKEGVWKWVNNDDLDTDNFMWGSNATPPEPDDFGKKQDHLALGLEDWPVGDAGQWNDLNGSNKLFFVVEFEGAYSYGN
jgi:hypothetical protein